jgi:hypothetical protein
MDSLFGIVDDARRTARNLLELDHDRPGRPRRRGLHLHVPLHRLRFADGRRERNLGRYDNRRMQEFWVHFIGQLSLIALYHTPIGRELQAS